MHIPDNYLSPETCAITTAVMIPVWAYSIHKVKKELPQKQIPMIGAGAAFSFTAMMFNIPMPGGTTGHAIGGTLIAILLGPEAACLAVTIALFLQAVLFGDGGILSFGANCFNMAFVLPFIGYYTQKILKRIIKNENISIGIGSYLGINAAALCAAIEFGIQPLLFNNAYCPYDLSVSIPAMMIPHLTVFGLAEIIFTCGVYAFIKKTAPEITEQKADSTPKPVIALLVLLIILTPLGLLAEGTAWGEWGIDEMEALGYSMKNFSFPAIMPDYTLNGLPDQAAYILSAVIGVSLCLIIFRLFKKEAEI